MSCMKATMTRIGGMKATMSLVCGTSLGVYQKVIVKEGAIVVTKDGRYVLVKKRVI